MRRKCITMLLALVMVVSLFAGVVPTSAAAAGSNYTQAQVVTTIPMPTALLHPMPIRRHIRSIWQTPHRMWCFPA